MIVMLHHRNRDTGIGYLPLFKNITGIVENIKHYLQQFAAVAQICAHLRKLIVNFKRDTGFGKAALNDRIDFVDECCRIKTLLDFVV